MNSILISKPGTVESMVAPKPSNLTSLGLSINFLSELLAKHLYSGGVLTLKQLSERTAVSGTILDGILNHLKKEACVEVLGGIDASGSLRYKLTDQGRSFALEALLKNGYVGIAPLPLERYTEVVKLQSVHNKVITKELVRDAFKDIVISESTLDKIGPALHSGRSIFIYGPSGVGKTFISRKLARLLGDSVFIPHAISVGDVVVQIFDPVVHERTEDDSKVSYDQRFVMCHRPVVLTGGELTMDMLEVQFDSDQKLYRAPLQLKATNGLYIIDDLGRQRMQTTELLNRWIVPMEEKIDYLTLGSGQRFPVLFDVALVFSTNLNPLDLADEAFLRRLGYKIKFDYIQPTEYVSIWRSICGNQGIPFDGPKLIKLMENFYTKKSVPLAPCHPRDLVGLIADYCRYHNVPVEVSDETWQFALDNYFIDS